MWSLILKQMLS
uniref:Uncharacterized protein n=1 Tax=Arundo donax TaxID=35708 RepID=A0A0A9FEJ3_ARUDO